MSLKLQILELVEGEDADGNSTLHMIVQQPLPRKFKVNLAKANAAELITIQQNVGGVLLLDMGEMVQNGAHALYFKSGGEIDVLVPPPAVSKDAKDTVPSFDALKPTAPNALKDPAKPDKPNTSSVSNNIQQVA